MPVESPKAAKDTENAAGMPGRRIDLGWAIFIGLTCSLLFAGIIAGAIIYKGLNLPSGLQLPTLSQVGSGVTIYDRQDHFICTVHADRDTEPVPLSKISKNLRSAVLAAEDGRFYQHHGVDFAGVARAAWANFQAHRIVEGGSTITQQLARNLFLDKQDRSYKRKLRESYIAWDLEKRYSKSKILETYLNEVYFGDGVNGAERAAMAYFNKHADKLSVAESAYIAGLIRSPSVLGSPEYRKQALSRQHDVINKMADDGFITKRQQAQALATKLAFKAGPHKLRYPYYVSAVLQAMHSEFGDQIWKHNWKVYTNLDQSAQASAQRALEYGIKHAPKGVNQGALVTMSVRDGAILAMIGGVGGYDNAQWNRALYPHTAGSSFKPFVYLAALANNKIDPNTLIADEPLVVNDQFSGNYAPKNYDGTFKGWMPVTEALCQSRNVCAVRVAQAVGIQTIIDTARAAGIRAKLDPYISLALGSCAVSPMEMATAYSTLARGGVCVTPQLIRLAQTTDGKINRSFSANPVQTLPPNAVAQLVQMMQAVVQRGTGTMARLPGIAVAGKTGTADKAKDIWFVGFTPDTVTAVWGGSDLNHEVRGHNVTGGVVMAKIWHDYMMSFYRNHPVPKGGFPVPEAPESQIATRLQDDGQLVNANQIAAVGQTDYGMTPVAGQISDNRVATLNANAPAGQTAEVQSTTQQDSTAEAEPVEAVAVTSPESQSSAAVPEQHVPHIVVQNYETGEQAAARADAQRFEQEMRSAQTEIHQQMTAAASEPM
jgi:1A family penicillin-binding protein